MATQAELLAQIDALTAQLNKVANEARPTVAATPVSDSPQGFFRGMTVSGTYRLTRIPKGVQVIALTGGDLVLWVAPTVPKGSYAIDWKLSNGTIGSKPFTVI